MVRYTKFRDDRPIRSRVILGKPEGGLHQPSPALAISPSLTAQGGGCDPPRVWLLSELELRLKKQRVACYEPKPLTPEFKVLGQRVTSEVRPMIQKWPKCESTDDFVPEQARAAI